MRPLHTVLDQIRWDARLDAARFAVRWLERGGDARTEPLTAFLARIDVPQHRVRAVLCDGAPVWDRDARIDRLDDVVGAVRAALAIARVAFWNVLDDETASARAPRIAATIASLDAHIVGLAELSAPVCAALAQISSHVLVVEGSVGALLPREQPWRTHRLPLPGRDALIAHAHDVTVVVAHLTSNVRGDRSARRAEQITALAAALPGRGPLLVLLDANTEDALVDAAPLATLGLVDAGAAAGATFGERRLDRVLVRGLDVGGARVVQQEPTASDHRPLVVDLAPRAPRPQRAPSPDTSIAVLPPPDIAAALDVVRAAHDDAHPRWPAHLHLAHPFVAVDALDDACIALARALVHVEPFALTLEGTDTFHHARGRFTVWARPLPSAGLDAAHACVVDAGPVTMEERPWTPHLSLASGTGAPPHVAFAAATFTVGALTVLVKDGERRVAREELPLGRASLADAVGETGLVDVSDAWRAAVAEVQARLPGVVRAVGSSAMGVRLTHSDVDLAWTPPVDVADPLALATAALDGRRIDAIHAPRVQAEVAGHKVDLLLGGDDALAAATRALDATPAQREALLALRVWMHRRGLTGEHTPRGVALLWLVTADDVKDAPAAAIVRAAWRTLADPHDVVSVSGAAFRSVSPAVLARLRHEAARATALVDGLDDDDAPWRATLTSAFG